MVKFLLNRPVAVFMTTLAILLIGMAAVVKLPTALMPDIAIPEITIQVSYPNNTARDIETNVVRPLRNQLVQVSKLKDINTETRDGFALLKLYFDYGTNTDFAFIEANEKIDAAINFLPRDLERPRAIKAAATDIPVLTLTITENEKSNAKSFLELSEFTQNVLKRRIEQLPDIALADISGLTQPEVLIEPNMLLLKSLNVNTAQLEQVIKENNFELGNLIVQNGIYQYNLKFLNPLRTIDDLKSIPINIKGKLFELQDLANISLQPRLERGQVLFNGKRTILIQIIKQSETKVADLKDNLNTLLSSFKEDYPQLDIGVHQDQTKLLEVSLSNLQSSLLAGSALAILIMFFFIKDIKAPLIIALSIPTSLIVSFLFMFLFGMSINIISLSGLILGVGMMIDNAIIIIDNITQKLEAGETFFNACASGTNEMIAPLITSVLTTCMIFLPLVFLSGITGALFYDQALAVSIGLGASLLVSILLIPVIFLQLRKKEISKRFQFSFKTQNIEQWYKTGFYYFSKRKFIVWGIASGFLVIGIVLLNTMPYSKLPDFKETEAILKIDWNENITVHENSNRIVTIFNEILDPTPYPLEKTERRLTYIAETGEQDFLLQKEQVQTFSEAIIYIEAKSISELENIKSAISDKLKSYPSAVFSFNPPKTIFDFLFGSKQAQLTAQVFSRTSLQVPSENRLHEIQANLNQNFSPIILNQTSSIVIQQDKLALYNIDYFTLVAELKAAFDQNFIDNLKASERFIPIKINYEQTQLEEKLSSLFITNNEGNTIAINNLITIQPTSHYKTIYADKTGEFLKFDAESDSYSAIEIINRTQGNFKNNPDYGVRFTGKWFEFENLGNELIFVLIIAILLLYFIMAAQFESLKQPLIILVELPIGLGGALSLLWLFGGTINVMSFIGLVVMSGIIINDSIIKIHTINLLRKEGNSAKEAVLKGGKLRLKPIVMTSLTTILALSPFLFIHGLGADLQRPLAIIVIGGLSLGTFISLYFLPFFYLLLEKK